MDYSLLSCSSASSPVAIKSSRPLSLNDEDEFPKSVKKMIHRRSKTDSPSIEEQKDSLNKSILRERNYPLPTKYGNENEIKKIKLARFSYKESLLFVCLEDGTILFISKDENSIISKNLYPNLYENNALDENLSIKTQDDQINVVGVEHESLNGNKKNKEIFKDSRINVSGSYDTVSLIGSSMYNLLLPKHHEIVMTCLKSNTSSYVSCKGGMNLSVDIVETKLTPRLVVAIGICFHHLLAQQPETKFPSLYRSKHDATPNINANSSDRHSTDTSNSFIGKEFPNLFLSKYSGSKPSVELSLEDDFVPWVNTCIEFVKGMDIKNEEELNSFKLKYLQLDYEHPLHWYTAHDKSLLIDGMDVETCMNSPLLSYDINSSNSSLSSYFRLESFSQCSVSQSDSFLAPQSFSMKTNESNILCNPFHPKSLRDDKSTRAVKSFLLPPHHSVQQHTVAQSQKAEKNNTKNKIEGDLQKLKAERMNLESPSVQKNVQTKIDEENDKKIPKLQFLHEVKGNRPEVRKCSDPKIRNQPIQREILSNINGNNINTTTTFSREKEKSHYHQGLLLEERSNFKETCKTDHAPCSPCSIEEIVSELSFSDVFKMISEYDVNKKSCEQICINIYDETYVPRNGNSLQTEWKSDLDEKDKKSSQSNIRKPKKIIDKQISNYDDRFKEEKKTRKTAFESSSAKHLNPMSVEKIPVHVTEKDVLTSSNVESFQKQYSTSNAFVGIMSTEYKCNQTDDFFVARDNDLDNTRRGGRIIREAENRSSHPTLFNSADNSADIGHPKEKLAVDENRNEVSLETLRSSYMTNCTNDILVLPSMDAESKSRPKNVNKNETINVSTEYKYDSSLNRKQGISEVYDTNEKTFANVNIREDAENLAKNHQHFVSFSSRKAGNCSNSYQGSGTTVTTVEKFYNDYTMECDDYDWYLELEK